MRGPSMLSEIGCNAKTFTRKWPDGKGGELTAILIMTTQPLPTIQDESVGGAVIADTIHGFSVEFKAQVKTDQFKGDGFSGIARRM